MATPIAATVAVAKMIVGGEDHPATFVQVEVRRCQAVRNLLTDARKDLQWLAKILRVTRERGEAATA